MLMHGNYLPLGQYSQAIIPGHFQYDNKDSLHLPRFPQSDLRIPKPGKRIGRLTFEERQQKIRRYRAKRSKRIWQKRINYSCRKRVADNRIRIKGRFVSKEEAQQLEKTHKSEEDEIKVENSTKQIFKVLSNS